MKYALTLAIIGAAQLYFAHTIGPWGWVLIWSGVSWIVAGAAYGPLGARVFGKRADGAMAWWSVLLWFPYLAMTWGLWEMQKRLTREPQCHEIADGLWLGRRCSGRELPPNIGLVADLTAEFWEPKSVRAGRQYRCLPTMDAAAPSLLGFQQIVETITQFPTPVYIHCALGHGRSATVAAAALIARGQASSVHNAIEKIRAARPGIEINKAQRDLLDQWLIQRGDA